MSYATLVSDSETIDLIHHETMIGRDPKADIVIKEPSVSNHHGYIKLTPDNIFIFEETSSNGTYVNDILRKKEKVYLNDGDRIKFGGSPIVYTFYIKSQSRNDPPRGSDPRADRKEERQQQPQKRRNSPSKLPPQRHYSNASNSVQEVVTDSSLVRTILLNRQSQLEIALDLIAHNNYLKAFNNILNTFDYGLVSSFLDVSCNVLPENYRGRFVYTYEVLFLFLPRFIPLIKSSIDLYILNALTFLEGFLDPSTTPLNRNDDLPYKRNLRDNSIALLRNALNEVQRLIKVGGSISIKAKTISNYITDY